MIPSRAPGTATFDEPARGGSVVAQPAPPTRVLYLHGFRSSPQSTKARQTADWLAAHRPALQWWCPQLPVSPRAAINQIHARLSAWPAASMAVVGSSLGGFYATVIAERLGCRAVVLNPAVNPARDLAGYVGELTSWHSGERFQFCAEHIAELHELAPPALTRTERYFAVIAKGDELLDWREMVARYAGCRIKLLEGSNHAISDFEVHLPDVLAFLGLT
jgi:predicted esterase YcpF (UPF0227 family)